MIENLNTTIFKLLVLSSLSSTSSFSQARLKTSNKFSISNSVFSHLIHPVIIHQPLSSTSFNSCLFKYIQTTAIQTAKDDFISKRIIFQLDGCIIQKLSINITQCIFKYCISRHSSGCFNLKNSQCFIQYNIFSSNHGKFGGCFHSILMKKFVLNQNLFDNNIATYFGAAYIEVLKNQLVSSQNNFTRNYGTKWVGALELYLSNSKNSIMHFSIFDHNSAKQCAAYFDLSSAKNFHNLDMTLFLNNTAERRGGSITDFSFRMIANYSNCVFIGNKCVEGNCIYIETKKSIVMLFNCFFDCSKEKAFYFNWKQFPGQESQIICDKEVVFAKENDNELIKKKHLEMIQNIPPVQKLEWFLHENH